jgi:hypothetical protein
MIGRAATASTGRAVAATNEMAWADFLMRSEKLNTLWL